MSENPFMKVAEEIQSINDLIKQHGGYAVQTDKSIREKIETRITDIVNFAEKNNVPIKLSFENILQKLKQEELGEMEEEDSEEYSEEYSDEDDDEDDDEDEDDD
jgi:hypothetical protein